MARNLRTLGVYGESLPTKKSKVVEASDFLIGGLVGQAERKYAKAYAVTSIAEYQEIFGIQYSSATYLYDAVQGFFQNVAGIDTKLYVKAHVGYTGSAIDAVVASKLIPDGTPENTLTIKAAYFDELEYGVSGNRTGVTITNGTRFSTLAAATCAATAVNTLTVDSVSGIVAGDIISIAITGGGTRTVYHKIASIDENAKTITLVSADLNNGHAETMALDDVISVLGFRLRVWRKLLNGVVSEVDTELGQIYCTTESAVSDFYVVNVFKSSKWIQVTKNTVTPATYDKYLPVDIATVGYLTSGADGTAATTYSHWSADLTALNNLPVRFIANPETTDAIIQSAIETYSRTRDDLPKVLYNVQSNRTKAQLLQIGQNYQRSDDVLGAIVADWVQVTDPFSTSLLAPARNVPNVGHVMGVILYTIGTKGIHYIPQKDTAIKGLIGLNNSNLGTITNADRTDLAEAGINIIQSLTGYGYIIRNLFTPSVTTEFQFLNGIVMREYIKVSAVDSLQSSENTPNSYANIQSDKMAILTFLYQLWNQGSTGTVPIGETFGQSFNSDGTATLPTDHFEVVADLTNNTQTSINNGERNVYTYFTYPAPAGSIKIGVGILLRS